MGTEGLEQVSINRGVEPKADFSPCKAARDKLIAGGREAERNERTAASELRQLRGDVLNIAVEAKEEQGD